MVSLNLMGNPTGTRPGLGPNSDPTLQEPDPDLGRVYTQKVDPTHPSPRPNYK